MEFHSRDKNTDGCVHCRSENLNDRKVKGPLYFFLRPYIVPEYVLCIY